MKKTAFAGSWYPGDAGQCKSQIREFMDGMDSDISTDYLAGIVPHAGWIYSGSIACRVLANVAGQSGGDVDTVVLFGGHLGNASPSFLLGQGGVETPLGDIQVAGELAKGLMDGLSAKGEIYSLAPDQFPDDNTLELQYPFIKYLFPRADILVVGIAPPLARLAGEAVVDSARALGRRIRVIGSTDMTHYGPRFGMTAHGSGRDALDWVMGENDRAGIEAMVSMEGGGIIETGQKHHNLCCPGAAGAAAFAAKKMGAVKGSCLDYATSYSDADSTHFVGYGGILFF
ncbi:MAG: AmmeMemoRadiSam system protein B [Desulfobacterales bacterium]|nr:AmmeMemoRadiSam system protein B [Desulfobacterales bacterium]